MDFRGHRTIPTFGLQLLVLLIIISYSGQAGIIFQDDFNNGNLATGSSGGFSTSDAAETVESGSSVTLAPVGGSNWTRVGIISNNSFDVGPNGFIATWELDHLSGLDRYKVTTLALRPTPGIYNSDSYNNTYRAGVMIYIGDHSHAAASNSPRFGILATSDEGDASTQDRLLDYYDINGIDYEFMPELADGATLEMTFTPAGWSLDVTGADHIPDAAGAWGPNFSYANFGATTYAGATSMRGAGSLPDFQIDQITIDTLPSTVPEPGSYASFAAILLICFCRIYRRKS